MADREEGPAVPALQVEDRSFHTYTKYYCEENIWHLVKKLTEALVPASSQQPTKVFVVFVSNEDRRVPLWHQSAAKDSCSGLVIWDYHVISIVEGYRGSSGSTVFDLDTRLPFPCPFDRYSAETFRTDGQLLRPEFFRKFRVVPAEDYLQTFASDRSHMMEPPEMGGGWRAPPPTYPCICTESETNNIEDFISMDPDRGIGTIFTLAKLNRRFSEIPRTTDVRI